MSSGTSDSAWMEKGQRPYPSYPDPNPRCADRAETCRRALVPTGKAAYEREIRAMYGSRLQRLVDSDNPNVTWAHSGDNHFGISVKALLPTSTDLAAVSIGCV